MRTLSEKDRSFSQIGLLPIVVSSGAKDYLKRSKLPRPMSGALSKEFVAKVNHITCNLAEISQIYAKNSRTFDSTKLQGAMNGFFVTVIRALPPLIS
jgi:hypothetical protein